MDQTNKVVKSQTGSFKLLESGRKIAYIEAGWHKPIVEQARLAFQTQINLLGVVPTQIDYIDVPGSLEIPLQARLLAKTGRYAIIVAAGLIVDGGIYRHDFVASTVLDAMMKTQLEFEVPILSVVLTPHTFQETEAHQQFFYDHFQIKGREAADACAKVLNNLELTLPDSRAA
jgi:6,7-dimethyl-8-ribityllumazine synthase